MTASTVSDIAQASVARRVGGSSRLLRFVADKARVAASFGRAVLRPAKRVLLAGLLLALAGCATVDYDRLSQQYPGHSETIQMQIDQMDAKHLKGLSIEQVDELLTAVTLLPQSTYKTEALERLFDHVSLDPAYLADQNQRLTGFHAQFISDPVIREAASDWKNMDNQARQQVLVRLGQIHALHFGHAAPDVRLFERPIEDGSIVGGYVSLRLYGSKWTKDSGPIYMNTHRAADWNDFPDVIGTFMQEVTHHYQGWLAHLHSNGKLDRNDPRYMQARVFWLNFVNYVKSEDDYDTYRNQPVERDGWNMTRRYEDAARKELKQNRPTAEELLEAPRMGPNFPVRVSPVKVMPPESPVEQARMQQVKQASFNR